jgi:GR25 family glycosyltransferase involved in LPS biosynthesis
MQLKFRRQRIADVSRFSAVDGEQLKVPSHWERPAGAYGCLLSHLEVVREARTRGVREVLIFEDDVVFDDQFDAKFRDYIDQLPPDWDMLFFGALHKDEPISVADNIARITKANSTYAYAIKHTAFDAFIELNARAETVLDHNSFVLQRQFNCYCFMPNLAWVETGYSDAQNKVEQHWYLKESLVLFGRQADRLLSETTIVLAHGPDSDRHHATENLMFLVDYYTEFFSPFIAMVVVEAAAAPAVNPEALPRNCKYMFLGEPGAFCRTRCFKSGLAAADPDRRLLILADSDIYLETLDIRANLRMCEQYDCVIGFSGLVELDECSSRRLRESKTTRGLDITQNVSQQCDQPGGCYWFYNREALDVGAADVSWPLAKKNRRVFRSPGRALRLH